MKIAIVDDEIIFVEKEYALICEALRDIGVKAECHSFNSVDDLIAANENFDAAFLDIEVGKTSGFAAAGHLYDNNPKCVIAFFTNYSRYLKKGYEFRAFRYILKNEPVQLIKNQIIEVINEVQRINKVLIGTYKGKKFNIPVRNIWYIETYRHVLTYHSKSGSFEEYKELQTVNKELKPYGFVRCHRSYIVNVEYINSISENKIYLNGTDTDYIPLGRSYRNAVNKAYLSRY